MNAQTKIETATLSSALVTALNEIEGVSKGKVNPAFKSKYVDLTSVLEAVRPVFAKYDMAVTQETFPSEDGVIVETVVLHASGDERRFGKLHVPANKRDAQGYGSALTYAKRYSLMTAFGLPAEDDDGNAAVAAGRPTRSAGKVLSDGQLAVLQGYADGGVIDAARFCSFFQIGSLKDLPADRYDEALRMAQAKQERQRQAEPVQ